MSASMILGKYRDLVHGQDLVIEKGDVIRDLIRGTEDIIAVVEKIVVIDKGNGLGIAIHVLALDLVTASIEGEDLDLTPDLREIQGIIGDMALVLIPARDSVPFLLS